MGWFWRTNRDILLDLEKDLKTMFEDLEAKVTALTSASDSAEALLVDIKAKLDAAIAAGGLTPEAQARLAAIATAIGKETDDLVAAVIANTPAAEPE